MGNRGGRRRRGPVAVLLGALAGLVGLVLLGAGGYGLALAGGDGGYVPLGTSAFRGSGSAVITDGYDWSAANLAGAHYGTVRVQVTGDAGKPVFVGIAPAAAAQRYLAGTAYTVATEYPAVGYAQHPGGVAAAPPARAGIWLASSSGTGQRTFRFDPHATTGRLVLVAMNPDGTASVAGSVRTAATVPALTGISAAVLAVGVLAVAGAVLLFRGRRTRRA